MLKRLGACDLAPKEELLRRIAGLKEQMAESKIDFAVIMHNVGLFYFAGTIQRGALVVPLDGDPLLFIERSLERAQMETPLDIIAIKRDKEIKDVLLSRGIMKGTGGMELDVMPVSTFERLKGILGFDRFVDVGSLTRELRVIKSPFELEQVKKSGAIIDRVLEKATYVVREGVREIDIDAELVAEGRRHGHQGFLRMRGFNQEMMNLYVTAGYTSGLPSHEDVPIAGVGMTPAIAQGSSLKSVEAGIPVLVDYGGGYNGYITDETRMYVAGELKERFKKPYEVTREIIEETVAFAKDGVDCTELFARASDRVKKAGLEEHFMGHGDTRVGFIGHGLGLEINELPVITPRHRRILREGMVFAFEPKIVFPGEGAVGIEVDFIVRKDGLERVTKTPIEIMYV